MGAPLLLDLSHTSHTRARTGIQRVARSIRAALGAAAVPVTLDPYAGTWRPLARWEYDNLNATEPAPKRGARWPLSARVGGRVRRILGRAESAPLPPESAGLIVPEVFSPAVGRSLPALLARVGGPRIALFHDAIALKLPELTPTKTVARFPAYLQELLLFDGIAAISDDSRDTLVEYWRWLGVPRMPPVQTIPLGIEVQVGRGVPADVSSAVPGKEEPTRGTAADQRGTATPPYSSDPLQACRAGSPDPAIPVVLSIGSIEGRKNHLALLNACESLWARGIRFELHLIGLAHPETGRAATERLAALQSAGRPIRCDGPADDAAVERAYRDCTFTVYPSLIEGFGLPVLESLAHGKPCICSNRGALGEAARAGGCLALDSVDGGALATGIEQLLSDPAELYRLTNAARQRPFRTWTDYVTELTAWMGALCTGKRLEARG